jgi:hypothetical protein
MVFTKLEKERWRNYDVLKLSAVWNAKVTKSLQGTATIWPASVPRNCQLYLDVASPHWLHRLEWWGPTSCQADDSLLMQMEFRDPKWLPPDAEPPPSFKEALEFKPPGKAQVMDQTKDLTERLKVERFCQAAQKKSAGSQPGSKKDADSAPTPKKDTNPSPAKKEANTPPTSAPPPDKGK